MRQRGYTRAFRVAMKCGSPFAVVALHKFSDLLDRANALANHAAGVFAQAHDNLRLEYPDARLVERPA